MTKIKLLAKLSFFVSFCLVFLNGCMYIKHYDELMRMKQLGDDQKQMQEYIWKQEELFEELKADIAASRLKAGASKKRILSRYGEPTICKEVKDKENITQTCFYRKPSAGIESEIIYLDFDAKGHLVSWQTK